MEVARDSKVLGMHGRTEIDPALLQGKAPQVPAAIFHPRTAELSFKPEKDLCGPATWPTLSPQGGQALASEL
eukprot:6410448-Lingulodinium_polyedra.AAC.1